MTVVVIIEPDLDDETAAARDVTSHEDWKHALAYVAGFAQSCDPGKVTLYTVDA